MSDLAESNAVMIRHGADGGTPRYGWQTSSLLKQLGAEVGQVSPRVFICFYRVTTKVSLNIRFKNAWSITGPVVDARRCAGRPVPFASSARLVPCVRASRMPPPRSREP